MVGGIGHRGQEFGLGDRLAFGAAFGGAGRGLLQRAFGRLPVGEDAGDRRVGRLAGELCGVKHLFADDDARARTLAVDMSRAYIPPAYCQPCAFSPLVASAGPNPDPASLASPALRSAQPFSRCGVV